jgi:glutamate-1-semialdehyde 2,1-aminomutase
MYQAGTLSGSPLAVAAGLATLEVLAADGNAIYARLEQTSARIAAGIEAAARKAGVACRVHRVGSMLGVFLTPHEVWSLADVDASDRAGFARLFHRLLAEGVHLPPSAYEALFVSAAHGEREVEHTVRAFERAFAAM